MANILMLPVGTKPSTSTTVNGRTYTAALGATLSVPDFDANVLEANGWIRCAQHGSGTTAQRPSTAGVRSALTYFDSSLGYVIVWEGGAWRNPANGNAV